MANFVAVKLVGINGNPVDEQDFYMSTKKIVAFGPGLDDKKRLLTNLVAVIYGADQSYIVRGPLHEFAAAIEAKIVNTHDGRVLEQF